MTTAFFVDVYNAAGSTKLGQGPLTAVKSWANMSRMDKAGEFSFSVLASDPGVSVLAKKCIVKCYALESSGPVYVGSGIVDRIETVIEEDGSISYAVNGDDLCRELNYRTVKFLILASGGLAITHAAALTAIAAFAPAGWTFTADPTPPTDSIYYEFAGESVLAALTQLAEHTGTHFYLSGDRAITFRSTFVDSGIRAIEVPFMPDVTETSTAYIEHVKVAEDTFDLITRIYPYGDGTGSTALAMTNTTRAAPAGYTLSVGSNYIQNDTQLALYGTIERVVQYKDIKELGVTLNDQQSAANILFDAGLTTLQIQSQTARFYELSLGYSPTLLTPTQTIRCILRRIADGAVIISLDDVLSIIEVKSEIAQDKSLRTTGLTVSTVQRYIDQETNPIVELIRSSQLR